MILNFERVPNPNLWKYKAALGYVDRLVIRALSYIEVSKISLFPMRGDFLFTEPKGEPWRWANESAEKGR